jgi:hypothetical protein
MAAETIFDFVAERLEGATDFDRLEARGTVRLALKRAGLDPNTLSAEREMRVVLQRVLPGELEARGVENADAVCTELADALQGFGGAAPQGVRGSSPEAIFKRIGGD